MWVWVCLGLCVEVRWQLCEVGFLLPPLYSFQELNSGGQAWQYFILWAILPAHWLQFLRSFRGMQRPCFSCNSCASLYMVMIFDNIDKRTWKLRATELSVQWTCLLVRLNVLGGFIWSGSIFWSHTVECDAPELLDLLGGPSVPSTHYPLEASSGSFAFIWPKSKDRNPANIFRRPRDQDWRYSYYFCPHYTHWN